MDFPLKDICHGHFILYIMLAIHIWIGKSHIINYILISISSDLLDKTNSG